jgi:hypothetical protein
MEKEKKQLSRKKFLSWGFGLTSVLALPSILWGKKPSPQPSGKKVKLLTQDGKLVEVDESVLKAKTQNKKASNKEIFNWMDNPSKK